MDRATRRKSQRDQLSGSHRRGAVVAMHGQIESGDRRCIHMRLAQGEGWRRCGGALDLSRGVPPIQVRWQAQGGGLSTRLYGGGLRAKR